MAHDSGGLDLGQIAKRIGSSAQRSARRQAVNPRVNRRAAGPPAPRPKPSKRPTVFNQPVKAPSFKPAQRQAARKVQRAQRAAPQIHALPNVPVKAHYTPQERRAIVSMVTRGAQKYRAKQEITGAQAGQELGLGGDQSTRSALTALTRASRQTTQANHAQLFREMVRFDHGSQGVPQRQTEALLKTVPLKAQAEGGRQFLAQFPQGEAKPYKPPKQKSGFSLSRSGIGLPRVNINAGGLLRDLTRPEHAIAGAVNAAEEGKPVGKAFTRGLQNKDTTTFGDIARKHGATPAEAAIAGVAVGALADPTTYATAGFKVPAEVLTKGAQAAQRGAEAAQAAGKAEKAAKLAERAQGLAQKAEKAPTNKGLQVGFTVRGRPRTTSGATSAKVSKKIGLSATATAIRRHPAAQAVGKALNPRFVPEGVTPEEWSAYMNANQRARSATQAGEKAATRSGRGVAKALKKTGDKKGASIVHAIEQDTTSALPPDLQHVAQSLKGTFAHVAEREKAAGILGTTRENYVPHQLEESFATSGKGRRAAARAKNQFAQMRQHEGTIGEINREAEATGSPLRFSENAPYLTANRLAKHAQVIAEKGRVKTIAEDIGRPTPVKEIKTPLDPRQVAHIPGAEPAAQVVGKQWTPDLAKLKPHESLYKRDDKGLHPLEKDNGQIDVQAATKALTDGEDVVALPRVIGQAEAKARFSKTNPLSEPTVGRGWDRFTSKIKTGLTVLNFPAYDIRNLTGDLFNSFLADTDAKSLVDAARLVHTQGRMHAAESTLGKDFQTGKLINLGGGRKEPADEFLKDMERLGVTQTGHVGAERYELAHAGRSGVIGKVGGAHPVEAMRGIGARREDFVRLGTALSAVRRGMSKEEAAAWSLKHHFDYGELTDAERGFLRRVFPFYTFTARNTKLQAEKLVTRPGKYATVEKVREEARKQAGLPADWDKNLKPYQQRGLPIPLKIGGKVYPLYPGLPITDLNRVTAALAAASGRPRGEFDLTLQNLHPALKALVEPLANYSFFFRSAIYRDKKNPTAPNWVPAPGWLTALPQPIQDALGVVDAKSKQKGQHSTKQWPALVDYFARLFPQTNFATQATTSSIGSRGQTGKQAVISQLSGVKVGNYDKTQLDLTKLRDEVASLRVQSSNLRDLGKTDSARKVERQMRTLNKQIGQLRIKSGQKASSLPSGQKPSKSQSGGPLFGGGGGGASHGGPLFGGGSKEKSSGPLFGGK